MRELTNLGDLIDRSKDQARVAVIDLRFPQQPREYSYGDVDGMSASVARYLLHRGLERGQRVAIVSLNRIEFLVTYLGIMRAGLVAVPVNTKLPASTIAHVFGDSDVRFAFTERQFRSNLPAGVAAMEFDADDDSSASRPWNERSTFDSVLPDPGEVAQVLYTSGSSGMPKGVPLSHEGQLWALASRPIPPGAADERLVIAQPLFHMNGLMATKGALRSSSSMVMMPAFEAKAYTQAMARYGVTWAIAVPTMFARVVKELESSPDLDLSRLTRIMLGSAPITVSMLERIKQAIPSATVGIGYGTTEAGPAIFGPHPDGRPMPPLALGVEAPGREVRLVDGPHENEGVLIIRNPAVMSGYLNLPDKTAQVLRDGWYYSGDVMRRDEQGFFYFVGRADDMLVCSGENVYPGEVEKLLEKHPDVQQAAVVPLPDEERSQVPVAFIVPRAGAVLSADEVKRFAIANGPAYQHPRRVSFVTELPWAGTNKVDKTALERAAREIEAAGGWAR